MSAPCPTCRLTGGFHDRATHGRVEVPAPLLKAGDRRDAYDRAEFQKKFPDALALYEEIMTQTLLYGDLFFDERGQLITPHPRAGDPPKLAGILASTMDKPNVPGLQSPLSHHQTEESQ